MGIQIRDPIRTTNLDTTSQAVSKQVAGSSDTSKPLPSNEVLAAISEMLATRVEQNRTRLGGKDGSAGAAARLGEMNKAKNNMPPGPHLFAGTQTSLEARANAIHATVMEIAGEKIQDAAQLERLDVTVRAALDDLLRSDDPNKTERLTKMFVGAAQAQREPTADGDALLRRLLWPGA